MFYQKDKEAYKEAKKQFGLVNIAHSLKWQYKTKDIIHLKQYKTKDIIVYNQSF